MICERDMSFAGDGKQLTLVGYNMVYVVDLASSSALSNEKRLIKNLLNNYTNVGIVGRPVQNTSETLTVKFGLALIQILDLDEKNQILNTNVWSRYVRTVYACKVKYTSICIAHFYAKRLQCAQTWITQFYLQITPCLPLLPSRRTSLPFGWYSFYRPTEGRSLRRPGWLVTYRNKVPPPGVEPGHGHPSQY